MKTKLPLLKIDPDFQNLIPPLSSEEYEQLELSVVVEGCREPIKVWRDYIIDGHNRYKICHEYEIAFQIEALELRSKEDAISWICGNLINHREMPENYRRYLIGRKYIAEKTVGVMNITGTNQYTIDSLERKPHSGKTASKVGEEFHISHSTVNKYLQYTKALDRLKAEFPDFTRNILFEEIKISQDNIIELSKMPKAEISHIISSTTERKKITSADMQSTGKNTDTSLLPVISHSSIKDMPSFDPDVYVKPYTNYTVMDKQHQESSSEF